MEDANETPDRQAKTSKKKLFRKSNLVVGSVILALLLAAGTLFVINRQQTSPIPEAFASKVSFPLYFPEELPAGLWLDESSFAANSDALVYSFSNSDEKRLVVTIQAKPKAFDVSAFRPTKEFATYIGRAYLVDLESRTTGAIVNDESLIFVNAPDGLPMDQLEKFVNSLRRVVD
jgi:hypothetical protein